MIYNDTAVIILLLATGYLLGIYLLLTLAQRTIGSSQYIAKSLTDVYTSYLPKEQGQRTDELERSSLAESSRSISSHTGIANHSSQKLASSSTQSIQAASSVR